MRLTPLIFALLSCAPSYDLTREQLLDPASCAECHPDHVSRWSGSMHAYAAEDPIFLAMNARGQRETDGELGDFCISCHAPVAVQEGLTSDGLDLDAIEPQLLGITCAVCHFVEDVEGDHNAQLKWVKDGLLRGGMDDPADNPAHGSLYSPLHDRNDQESARMCGSCHDVVTPVGLHLEKTYAEWQGSFFAQEGPARQSCGHCHMRGEDGYAAIYPGAKPRRVHDHSWPGVDLALTEFPNRDDQRDKVLAELAISLLPRLCVSQDTEGLFVELLLENAGAGHDWPSGVSHDRRAWVELHVFEGEEEILSGGVVPQGTAVRSLDDPHRWDIGDTARKADGSEAHMFWDAVSLDEASLLPFVTSDPADPAYYHWSTRKYRVAQVPTRVVADVWIRPVGLDVLDDLINTGDLDPAFRSAIETLPVSGAHIEWEGSLGDCTP